ncbi:hypothetical protein QYE76_053055 [Lolium multiflorum]|uniref:Reverse transcriptase Ty1/copia-type domain-containing protein n=1 Tax=Lolium multiflorum TaxID=4521 RepID=A0AAD8SWH4_LOLMU|nr:hypothetical protein QYE76_053055 [Lolium multiflorum]
MPSSSTQELFPEPTMAIEHFENPVEDDNEAPKRSKRQRTAKSFGHDFIVYLVDDTPTSISEAYASLDADYWKEAVRSEMDSILANGTWEITDRPYGCKPVGCKWVFKKKLRPDGTIEKYKARLVAKGYTQKEVPELTVGFHRGAKLMGEVPILGYMEPFVQTEVYQLGNGGDMIFERDLHALSESLGRSPPVFYGGQVNDQPGGQLQWVIMADLPGKPESPMFGRIQFSLRENNWADGLTRAMQEALARLCGQNAMALQGGRFAHLARHNSLGVPLNLPFHPVLRHHVDHLDFMLCETRTALDNSRGLTNYAYLHDPEGRDHQGHRQGAQDSSP